ncbi:POK25 protein, partial [Aramus guarauna]|nr:POK25 protein [Aramus guarauna]
DQWPLPAEKVAALQVLVQEQLQQGHLAPTTSPWNSLILVIKKKSGKWRLLHDLQHINSAIEDMGSLQPGLPAPAMLPRNWDIIVVDLKDCFFTIPLHPDDAPRFAFSIPKVNQGEPADWYHWSVLPQGMKNSLTVCQVYLVRCQFPDTYIYHYMDDILLASPTRDQVQKVLPVLRDALHKWGLRIAPEKIQTEAPWKYLGWKIVQQTIQ